MSPGREPREVRVQALRADVRRAGELTSQCVAEALVLGVVVPVTVHEAVAALGRWEGRIS